MIPPRANLLSGWVSVALVMLLAVQAHAAQKRNVLLLISDDLCADIGCYGGAAQTPSIDRLASRGVRFDRAYCQYPLCGPSRASFMTGLRPDTTGVLANDLPVRHKLQDVVTLPQLFRQNGYYSARVGKIYHLAIPKGVGTPGPDDPQSWDETIDPKGNEYPRPDEGELVDPEPKDWQSFRYNILKSDGSDQHDHQAADHAIRILREKKDQPFFLAVGFIRPHVPLPAPRRYFDMYPLEKIKLPHVPANDHDDIPAWAFRNNYEIDRGMTPQQCRQSIRAYYACTSFMDTQLGRVTDELDKLGLAQNTVIVFLGDHGYYLGQHRTWQKSMLFEGVARIPLIITAPGVKPAQTRALTEAIDIYPTVAELCGLTTPQRMEGTALTPVLNNPQASVKEAAYTQIQRATRATGRSVRTDRFRYTEWTSAKGKMEAELYDHETDPNEFTNLANDPKHASTVSQMKALLVKK